jgi:hypothetical protein
VNTIITQCENVHLDCCVQIHSDTGIYEANSAGLVSKLEAEVLTRILQEEGNIFAHEQGLFFTHENVALLVKNLPLDKATDEMQKALSALVENANTMLLNLDKIHAFSRGSQNQLVSTSLKEQFTHLLEQFELQKDYKKDGVKIVDEVLASMESSFVDMGLTFNQEQTLLGILNAGIDRSVKHYEQGTLLDDQLEALLKAIASGLNN